MIHSRMRHRSQRAVAAVEFAALLPLILTLLVGLWEVGRLVETQQLLTNAAREGGRQAATGQVSSAAVQQLVKDYLNVAGLPTTNVTVTVAVIGKPGVDVSNATFLDRLSVTVTIPYNDIRWTVLSAAAGPSDVISAQVFWVAMVDKAYPNPTDAPQG
jgi:Flp pilus assembly protein TadG